MQLTNKHLMDTFTQNNLPSLATCTLAALELFADQGLPEVHIPQYHRPVIVGSGNAKATASILYAGTDAIFADENNYREALDLKPDGAVIFSASGEKHATVVSQYYHSHSLPTTLVTCNPNSSAGKIVGPDNTIVTPKNREPYTYNTSTYMGWILAKTHEDPGVILDFINHQLIPAIPQNIGDYQGYLLITPDMFSAGNHLFDVKFTELFARRVARDIRTFEESKHAITVVPFEEELCLQFGEGHTDFVGHKLVLPLPQDYNLATIMAIGYYTIGRIQESKPQWFKDSIKSYIARATASEFGHGLSVIVE